MMSEKVIQLRERLAGLLPGRRLLLGRALEEQKPGGPINAQGMLDYRQLPKGGIAELVAENNSSTPRDFLVALLENRRQLGEMIDSAVSEVPPIPQPFVPRRRSESQPGHVVV